jgi:hypothetical protein
MGCCYKKNYLLKTIDDFMKNFYFRVIRQDFIINQIKEFNSKAVKSYHEFWAITKLLGIHPELQLQVDFWESAFVTHVDNSLDGLLLIFLLLCKADTKNKLEYLKYYLSTNINHSKESDNNLIMNLYEFKKIIMVYFSCLTIIPFETYLKIKDSKDEKSDGLMRERFNETNIKLFTDFIIKDYVKKNFYINAGKFLEEKIEFLINDNLIRNTIYKFNLGKGKLKIGEMPISEEESSGNNFKTNQFNTENKPLKSAKVKKHRKTTSCCSGRELIKNKNKYKKSRENKNK